MAIARIVPLACLVLLLAACGSGMQGTYEDAMGLSQLRFDRDGSVVQSAALGGVEVRLRYEVDDDRVRLSHPEVDGAALVLTRVDDNTLSGPMGVIYRRVAD
ncbi:hypothetical protein [Pseudoxanthomonas sp. PXM02]|jgi:hypothetical protein|uniref:hypothetical protein n=1 Tax=Pseudoxanthomonas sp. PXM02 TaxID=2769294 RepID=UPI00177F0DFF|nr:hypothetical protein [Pseudoxanthomonas sp. PXM02]MBD9477866.1 hypothetical protein [Pseudoxanthomonas sp. PXM02]